MGKLSLSSFLTFLIIVCLVEFCLLYPIKAQGAGTSVSGIIVTDTTWTQAGSPYTLIGNVLVNTGATLTIQPGTAVNLAGYYLMVNGTLQAIGNSDNPVTFNYQQNTYSSSGMGLIFTPYCNGWNSTSSTGCILQNAVVNSPLTISNSVEVTRDSINNGINVQSQISELQTGTPVISNSNIKGGITVGNALGSAIIVGNTISGGGISFGSMNAPNVTVTGNTISNCSVGINVGCWGTAMTSTVQLIIKNLIFNNSQGIVLADWEGGSQPTIENNTITNNTVGICVSYPWGDNKPILDAAICGNNIGGNSKYDFQNQQPTTVDAAYNWWGTTDTKIISQSIYDYYDDFNIGVVTYTPFLTSPNPDAPTSTPISSTSPTPTPAGTTNSTATPTPTLTAVSNGTSQSSTTGQNSILQATTDKGEVVNLPISGNITASQIHNVIIATNQSASTTIVSFSVRGPSGNIGFSNITIPKVDIPYGKVPAIYIDDQLAQNQGYTQDANNYYVWYTTHFSAHQVSIIFRRAANSTPKQNQSQVNWPDVGYGVGLGFAIAATMLVALMLMTRSRKSQDH